MDSLNKSFIIFYLIICILGAFAFHWIFVDKMMSVSECIPTNCVYSLSQTVPQKISNILLVALMTVLFALVLPLAMLLYNKLDRMPGRMFLKWKVEGFCHKLISWLKILERRDPEAALIAARISDFRQ